MIYVEMSGRLGNQMFRYAFARRLQLQNPQSEELTFDFRIIDEQAKKGDPTWEDALRYFQVVPYQYYDYGVKRHMLLCETKGLTRVLCILYYGIMKCIPEKKALFRIKLATKILPALNRKGVYWLREGYYPFKYSTVENKFVHGSFECAQYYIHMKKILQKEFTPKYAPFEKNKDFYDAIERTESVCISIRRGNFLKYKKHDVCSTEYFLRAMQEMKKMVPSATFFVFSDEIDWVKENLQFPFSVRCEDGTDPVWEKLRMMYSCKHFIISNSTFSWWAQYLSRNKNKKVIAPKRWFNSEYQPPLYETGWHIMEVN